LLFGNYLLKPGFLYLLPQNQKFKPIFSVPSQIDHSFFDFITVPQIDLAEFLDINPQKHPILYQALSFALSVTDAYHYTGTGQPHTSILKSSV